MCKFYDETKKLWGNFDQQQLKDADKSLGHAILELLALHGAKIAQINDDTGVEMSYHEVWLKTVRVAQNVQKRGFQPGDKFGFMAKNSDQLLPIFLASICLTCPIVPLHSMLSKDEIISILEKTDPSTIFCDAEAYDVVNEALKELQSNVKVFIFGEAIDDLEPVGDLMIETGEENSFVPIRIDIENDIAGMFCSSGTTGPSKCVCVSYGHSVYDEPVICDPDSVILDLYSIYWTVGIKVIIDCIYSGATRIIYSKSSSPTNQLKLIEKYKVNYLNCVPSDLIAYLKNDLIDRVDLSNVQQITSYGSKMPCKLVAELNRYFPNARLVSSYGLTELGEVSLCLLDGREDMNGEELVDGCLAKIVDSNENCCGPNVSGEVRIKKRYKFPGYFKDLKATMAAVDDEGFFRTGDIGYFDENGILYIGDRMKNVLNTFYFDGVLVPSEIEEVLIKLPDLKDVCVVGIEITSGMYLPAAVAVRRPNSKINQRDVFKVAAENFPDRSKLRGGVYFVDSLPKTHNGKMIRKEITDLATAKFTSAKSNDPDLQSYLSDFPDEFRRLI